MSRKRWYLGVSIVLFLAAAGAARADAISDIVAQVSQDYYSDFLDNHLFTHANDNRGRSSPQHDQARTYLHDTFRDFGLTASLDAFSYGGSTYYNVVGIHQGDVSPGSIYIVGAHYDSKNNPGADDNASGVAGVLEAARVLSQHSFQSTLVFIAFDVEEDGLWGSKDYAQKHAADTILGMISMDMIAYNPEGTDQGIHHDKAYVYGRAASDPIKQDLAAALALFGNGVTAEIGGDVPYSDHAPFEAKGKPAALLIEHAWRSNPYYHQAGDSVDTPDYLDYEYATNLTRGVVGYLASSAVLVPEPEMTTLLLGGCLAWWVLVCRRRAARL